MYRVRGLNPMAAGRMVGATRQEAMDLAANANVTHAIAYFLNVARQETAVNAVFTRDDATAMYMEAHAHSANATEEIKAIDSLVKLHGLAQPEKKEVVITRADQLKDLDDDALMEIAGRNDIHLSPEDYVSKVKDD